MREPEHIRALKRALQHTKDRPERRALARQLELAQTRQRLKAAREPFPVYRGRRPTTLPESCVLCNRPFDTAPTYGPHHANLDHCHFCGALRGVLCGSCNTTLTRIETPDARTQQVSVVKLESSEWRAKAVRYLRASCSCFERRMLGEHRPEAPKPLVRRRPKAQV